MLRTEPAYARLTSACSLSYAAPGDVGGALPTTTDGDYVLLEEIGEGGMGVVYAGVAKTDGRRVAVKVMKHLRDKEAELRFRREVVMLSALRHEHIVRIEGAGRTSDGRPYLAMEYLDGVSLRQELLGRGRMQWGRAVGVLLQVAAALRCAHDVGVVHRDIKPENVVLVRGPDGVQRVKVVDFGLAKVALSKRAITAPGTVLGTPAYMAPERMLGTGVDHRSDLYALGVLAYELLTGTNPFAAPTTGATLARVLDAQRPRPPSAASASPAIPASLDDVVMSLLALDPADRPQRAADVEAALARLGA